MTVMAIGFTEGETRLGLRACDGNIQNAVAHIMKRREEKKENGRKKGIRRSWLNILAKLQMGTMNVDTYEMLLSMGCGKGASAEALRQANNDLNLALKVIQIHPEFLDLPDPVPQVIINDSMIAQVTAMGFEPEMSRRVWVKYNADVQKAIDELVNCGGVYLHPYRVMKVQALLLDRPITPRQVNSDKMVKEEKEAIDRLVSDLPDDEEDYLDISLEEEKHFLQKYMALMLSLNL